MNLPTEYPTDLNELAQVVHQANIKWWQDPATGKSIERNKYELLALIISELSECLEGERKNCMDDKLPHRKMAEVELADAKIRILDYCAGLNVMLSTERPTESCCTNYTSPLDKKGIPENKGEAIYVLIQLVCFSGWLKYGMLEVLLAIDAYALKHGYDIQGAFVEKMAYNTIREDHKHEARLIAGGKQF